MPRAPAGTRRSPLAALAHRDYALYWSGRLVSQLGTRIEFTATTWLLYEITSSPLLAGLGGVFRALPVLTLSLIGGTFADRLGPRRLLLGTQLFLALASFGLGAVVTTGRLELWHVYVFILANGIIESFDGPARNAMVPSLVPARDLQNALTLNAMLFRSSTLGGPALAGILIANAGVATAYFANAFSYMTVIGALLAMRVFVPAARMLAPFRSDAVDGLRFALADPIIRSVLLLEAGLSMFGLNQTFITIYAHDVLGSDAAGLGILLSALGAGAILGLIALLALGDVHRKGQVMIGAGSLYVVAVIAFASSRSFASSFALLAVVGFADVTMSTMRNTIAQLITSDAYRGRVMSLILLVTRGLTGAGQAQTGASVGLFGVPLAATLGALVYGSTLAAVAVRSPRFRRFEAPPWIEHGPALEGRTALEGK